MVKPVSGETVEKWMPNADEKSLTMWDADSDVHSRGERSDCQVERQPAVLGWLAAAPPKLARCPRSALPYLVGVNCARAYFVLASRLCVSRRLARLSRPPSLVLRRLCGDVCPFGDRSVCGEGLDLLDRWAVASRLCVLPVRAGVLVACRGPPLCCLPPFAI